MWLLMLKVSNVMALIILVIFDCGALWAFVGGEDRR